MTARHPAWHSGWEVPPNTEFIIVYHGEQPIAGSAIDRDLRGGSIASRLCVTPDTHIGHAGSALLDVLEAVALGCGSTRLTLDSSVFLHTAAIPYLRHGYVIGPPYDGDADAAVSAERVLRLDWE